MTVRWQNWAGNQRAAGIEVRRPSGNEQIAAVLAEAVRTGRTVRPVGSGHSFTGIARPEQLQLRFDAHASAVSLDAAGGTVTVQSGMPLRRLNRMLAAAGLALANLGDVDAQTVGGAIATGTHGTGARHGGLSAQVTGMTLALPDGRLLRCSPRENREVFHHARVGLGALGVVTEVTMAVQPAFALQAEEIPGRLPDLLADLAGYLRSADHVEFYWFPHTNRVLTKRNTRLEPGAPTRPLPGWRRVAEDELLSNAAFGAVVGLSRRVPPVTPAMNRISAAALSARRYSDDAHRVFCSPRRVRFIEMEYALPLAAAAEALQQLRKGIERDGLRVPFPVEVRVAPAEEIPLSTAYGRETAYIAVHLPYRCDPGPYFGLAEGIFTRLEGRPHWGKLHGLRAQQLAGLYPEFAEFVALRDRLDPGGVLSNPYLRRVLGPELGAA